jgi:hypothetical protein
MHRRSRISQLRQHIGDKSTISPLARRSLTWLRRGEKPRQFAGRDGQKLEKAIRKE